MMTLYVPGYQSLVLLSCYMYIANCTVTFEMSGNRLIVKLSETDILFLLILNVLDWNKSHYLYAGWCVISFHVFYIMFLLVKNKTKNSSGGFKTTALIHVTMHYSKQLKTENIGMLSIFHILNQYNSGFYKPQQ